MKKKMQAGGVAGKEPKAGMVDKDGAYTKVQERTLAGTKMAKKGAKISKAKDGGSFAKLAPPYDKATFADKIAGAKKNAGKAMYGKTMKAKSGAKMSMKKCKSGC